MGLHLLRPLLPYLRAYRGTYLLGLCCLVTAIGLRLAIPLLLGQAIDELRALAREVEQGVRSLDRERLLPLVGAAALGVIGAALVGSLFRTASRVTILGACRRVVHDLREVLFDKLARLAPSFYLRYTTGQLMSRNLNDLQNVQGLAGPVLLYIAETVLLYLIGIALMAAADPWLCLWTLLPFPYFLWRARSLAYEIQEGSRRAQDQLGVVSERVSESLAGQLVIKTLGLEAFDLGRFAGHAESYRQLNLAVTRTRTRLIPLMTALVGLSLGIALVLGPERIRSGALSGGEFVAFLFYLRYLAAPTATLGFVISSLQRGTAAFDRIQEVLVAEETLAPRPDLRPLTAPRGELELRGLSVRRRSAAREGAEPRERAVLDDVSVRVAPGETLGLVGHTGAGKSTLVQVLARLLEVPPGTLFYDGQDATELDPRTVRAALGWVPQDAFLFSATLRENLLLGRSEATEAELAAAVAVAQLDKDLAQLPQGLDTMVGERGVTLSGGQRQRAALARAVLARPTVLLLDDTLSAVDTETAEAILTGLRPVMRGRTTVLVAHRLSTVCHADRILVLAEGRVAESGTHRELLARGGLYRDLWESQAEQPVPLGERPR